MLRYPAFILRVSLTADFRAVPQSLILRICGMRVLHTFLARYLAKPPVRFHMRSSRLALPYYRDRDTLTKANRMDASPGAIFDTNWARHARIIMACRVSANRKQGLTPVISSDLTYG